MSGKKTPRFSFSRSGPDVLVDSCDHLGRWMNQQILTEKEFEEVVLGAISILKGVFTFTRKKPKGRKK